MKNKILLIIFSFFTFFLFFDNVNAIATPKEYDSNLSYTFFNSALNDGDFNGYSTEEFIPLIIDSYNSNKTSSSPELLILFDYDRFSYSYILRVYYVTKSDINFAYGSSSSSRNQAGFLSSFTLAFEENLSSYVFNGSENSTVDNLSVLESFVSNINSVSLPNDYVFQSSVKTVSTTTLIAQVSQSGGLIYYSGNSARLVYDIPQSIYDSTSTFYYYLPKYNNERLSLGSHIPSYYEFLGLSDPPVYEPELPDPDDVQISSFTNNYYGFMLSQIPVSNIYDYKVRFTVGQRLIYSDIDYQYNLFGRVNNGTYFTYEPISCTVGTSNEEPYFGSENFLDTFNVYQSKTFGIMDCSSDLTKYDYVYVNAFNDNFDDNDITYFGYTSNYGYVNANDFIANPTKVVDYFDFTKTSNMFFTSKCSSCGLYLGFDLSNFLYSFYDLSNFKIKDYLVSTTINSSFLKFYRFENIGLDTNQGFGINLYSNYDSGSLYFLADSDILVSFDSDISTNNNFTYFDSSGNVVNNIFDVYHIYDSDVGTNVDSYFAIVSSYINSISSDIKSISNVFQHVYDLAPEILQTLILVFYVLAMSYILFKIIRK